MQNDFPQIKIHQPLRFCLRVWRGKDKRVLEKRKKKVEEIEYIGRGGFWRVNFSS